MNADELRELAKTLEGIADGQPWQFEGCEFPWIDAWKHANPISVITDGLGIRLKPWALGRTVNGHTLPEGREWHRQDWTQDMLPEPYRPLMLGENRLDENRLDEDQYFDPDSKIWEKGRGHAPMRSDHYHSRTTRPIPVEPAPVMTPEQIAPLYGGAMTKIDDGGPAFPNKDAFGNMIPGMSLRAWLAGQALTGIQAFLYGAAKDGALKTDVDDRTVAKCACAIADAVIAALKGGANE